MFKGLKIPGLLEEETFSNSFYEATITWTSKQNKDNTQKRKLQGNITDEHRYKTPQQNFSKQNSESSYTMIKLGLFQECKDSSIYANQSM